MVMTKASMFGEPMPNAEPPSDSEDLMVMPDDPAVAKGSGKAQPSVSVGSSMPGCPPAARPSA